MVAVVAAMRHLGGGGGGHAAFGGGGGGHAAFGGGGHAAFGAGPSAFSGRTAAAAPSAGGNFSHGYNGHGYNGHGHDHFGHGFRGGFGGLYAFGGPGYYDDDYYDNYDNGCWVRRLVPTPYGLRWRLVDVCD